MDLLITRLFQEKGKATVGHLYVDGKYECFTLEPAAEEPFHAHRCKTKDHSCSEDHPCIPAGKYRIGLRDSPGFGPDTIELLKVPGRSAILIHAGNFDKETLGCVIVGYTHTNGAWEVHRSRDALKALKAKVLPAIRDNAAVWIEVVDSFKAGKMVA